jgi:hypothetical protein
MYFHPSNFGRWFTVAVESPLVFRLQWKEPVGLFLARLKFGSSALFISQNQ